MKTIPQKVYITLVGIGPQEKYVLDVLSKIQGLADTPEQLVRQVPCHISGKVSRGLAQKVKAYLEQAGARVALEDDLPDGRPDEETWLPLGEAEDTSVERWTEAETKRPESEVLPTIYPDSLPQRAPARSTSSPQAGSTEYAQRLEQMTTEMLQSAPRRKRSARKPQKKSALLMKKFGIPGAIACGCGLLLWFYLSGQFGHLANRYEQNPVVGQVGVLDIVNPEAAALSLHQVIGTRVIQPIPFEGEQARLKRGDYYVEARKGAQVLRFPVYLAGRGHRLTISVDFPLKQLPSENFAYIPAGWFRMGNKETDVAHFGFPDEQPSIDVYVSGFSLSKYEVTNREFLDFIDSGGYRNEVYWERLIRDWPSLVEQVPAYGRVYGNAAWQSVSAYIQARFIDTDDRPGPRLWEDHRPPYDYGTEAHPVTGISLYEADAYCRWLTQTKGMIHRLPTEAEWEKAARGHEGYFFAYGNEYDAERGNTETGRTQRVGTYPANGYGLYDMTGNAWEWVADQYQADTYQRLLDEYQTEIRNPLTLDETKRYARGIVRGGSYRSVNRVNARVPTRFPMFPNDWHTNIGFRYVVVP